MRFAIPALLTLAVAAVVHAAPTRIASPLVEGLKLKPDCYLIVGRDGVVGTLGVSATENGNAWDSQGDRGVFEDGQIWYGDTSYGTIEGHDFNGDGWAEYADLDFVGLPPGWDTHYTLEPCDPSTAAGMLVERNPFRVITS